MIIKYLYIMIGTWFILVIAFTIFITIIVDKYID